MTRNTKNYMAGKQQLQTLAKLGLSEAKRLGADEAEVVLWNGVSELTRFANTMIHQSVVLSDSLVHLRIVWKKRISVARCNQLDEIGIKETVKRAIALLSFQKKDPHFVSLPKKATYTSTLAHYRSAKHVGALGRARKITHIIAEAKREKLSASGAFSETIGETLVANTNGVSAYHKGMNSGLSTILTGEKGSGFASASAKGGAHIDEKAIARQTVLKATHGELVDVEPGEYEVVLEPAAVGELLDFFAWLGPNARIYHEDVSFFQGNLGKRVFHESLTIMDDPLHRAGYPIGFDYEGVPKRKLTLVDRGVLKNVVYDSYHAGKHKAKNTGHALLAPNTWGPVPTHMVLKPGKLSVEEMIKNVKKGLLVTRFWYTRVIHHKKLIVTGMTRDGTFLIEKGKIVGRVRNLRYTESVIEAFKDIRGIGKDLQLVGTDEGSPTLAPALHLGRFRFTSSAKHS